MPKPTSSAVSPYWAVAGIALLFEMFIIAPGRGAGWGEDEGLFMYSAWHAVQGLGPDTVIPQAPHYLFNALLMKLGMREVLSFRWAFHISIFVCASVFFLSLDARRLASHAVPLGVATTLLINLNTIFNHYTLSIAALMLGLGLYFFSTARADNTGQRLLMFLSAVVLAIASVANLVIGIGVCASVVMIFVFDRHQRSIAWLAVYALATAALVICYVTWLGSEGLVTTPVAHDKSMARVVGRSVQIALVYVQAAVLLAVVAWASRKYLGKDILFACKLLVVVFVVQFFFYHALYMSQTPPLPLLKHGNFILLSAALQHPTRTIGLSALCSLMTVLMVQAVLTRPAAGPKRDAALRPLSAVATQVWQHISQLDAGTRNLALAGLSILLIELLGSAASNTHIFVGMNWVAGPAIGLVLLSIDRFNRSMRPMLNAQGLGTAWVIGAALLAATHNHAENRPVFSTSVTEIRHPRLIGIYESADYHAALSELQQAYNAARCSKGVLLATEYMPMVFYILEHPAPKRMEAIRPAFFFPNARMIDGLSRAPRWCVLHGMSLETSIYTDDKGGGIDPRAGFIAWVKEHKTSATEIASPSKGSFPSLVLYAGGTQPANSADMTEWTRWMKFQTPSAFPASAARRASASASPDRYVRLSSATPNRLALRTLALMSTFT
jgi:hypothetical protein